MTPISTRRSLMAATESPDSTSSATGSPTRVLLSATDGERDWTTIGVSPNIIEASWRALEDSVVYGLLHRQLADEGRPAHPAASGAD
jgi:hypothetical protein